MRKMFLFLACMILFFSCKERSTKTAKTKVNSDKVQLTQEENNCATKKFRLCKEENYFKISEKHIKLKIPVTDNRLKYLETKNISSDRINAILVHFLGGPDCTPNSGETYKKNIKPIKFEDIGLTPDQLKDSLLVVMFVNDTLLTRGDITDYVNKVKGFTSYRDAVNQLRKNDECIKIGQDPKGENFVKPREDDGDVIGGNG